LSLSLDERQSPQILSVQVKQIERDEDTRLKDEAFSSEVLEDQENS